MMVISRRSFLRQTVLTSAGLLVPANALAYLFQDNDYFTGFPREIPGAAKIEKYGSPGAKRCLVHVRQKHYVDGPIEEQKRIVAPVQEDIYQILSHLIETKGLKKVYAEGITPEIVILMKSVREMDSASPYDSSMADMLNEIALSAIRDEERLLADSNTPESYKIGAKLRIDQMKQQLEEVKKSEMAVKDAEIRRKARLEEEKERSAANKLYLERRIDIAAAEILEANIEASTAPPNSPEVTDLREDILLAIVDRNDEPYAVTVYGGAHDWRNNVDEWNADHADKFSLITVTPKRY